MVKKVAFCYYSKSLQKKYYSWKKMSYKVEASIDSSMQYIMH